MQLRVNIGNHELTALLDSGSTHNFVSMEAARHIGLSFHDSKGKNVVVANGDRVVCRGLARDVAICIAGSFFTVDCYTIPLDCYDMVLGVSFLRTLGPILWDFDDLCMTFWHHGQRLLWKGIGSTRWDIQPTGRLHSISSESSPLLNRLLESFTTCLNHQQHYHNHGIVIIGFISFLTRLQWPFAPIHTHKCRRRN